jgi:hemerythrin-like domain-containing protein
MSDTIDVLIRQHLDVLVRLDGVAEQFAALCAPLEEFLTFLGDELDRHFTLEEEAFFPVLARHRRFEEGAVRLMQEEHVACRDLAGKLDAAVRHGTVAAQVETTQAIIDLLRSHIAKEDTILFALARVTLSADELREVEQRARGLR